MPRSNKLEAKQQECWRARLTIRVRALGLRTLYLTSKPLKQNKLGYQLAFSDLRRMPIQNFTLKKDQCIFSFAYGVGLIHLEMSLDNPTCAGIKRIRRKVGSIGVGGMKNTDNEDAKLVVGPSPIPLYSPAAL